MDICIYILGHLDAFVKGDSQKLRHSYTDGGGCHARCRPAHQEQFGVQYLAQGHQTSDFLMTRHWLYQRAEAATIQRTRVRFSAKDVTSTSVLDCLGAAPLAEMLTLVQKQTSTENLKSLDMCHPAPNVIYCLITSKLRSSIISMLPMDQTRDVKCGLYSRGRHLRIANCVEYLKNPHCRMASEKLKRQ